MRSVWEKSTSGPDRRMYELTPQGREELDAAAKALMATDEILDVFLSRYSEFVARQPAALPASDAAPPPQAAR